MQPQGALHELLVAVMGRQLTRNTDEIQLLLQVPSGIEQLSSIQQTLASLRALHAHLNSTLAQLVHAQVPDPRLHALIPGTSAALEHVEVLHAEHCRASTALASGLQQVALKLQAYASVNAGLVAELRMDGLNDKADSKAQLAEIESATAAMAAAHLAMLPSLQPQLSQLQAQHGQVHPNIASQLHTRQIETVRAAHSQVHRRSSQQQLHPSQQQGQQPLAPQNSSLHHAQGPSSRQPSPTPQPSALAAMPLPPHQQVALPLAAAPTAQPCSAGMRTLQASPVPPAHLQSRSSKAGVLQASHQTPTGAGPLPVRLDQLPRSATEQPQAQRVQGPQSASLHLAAPTEPTASPSPFHRHPPPHHVGALPSKSCAIVTASADAAKSGAGGLEVAAPQQLQPLLSQSPSGRVRHPGSSEP